MNLIEDLQQISGYRKLLGLKHEVWLVLLLILRRSKGFTLVELLVVVLLISILAGIAIPSFLKQVDKAGYAKARIHMTATKSELMDLYEENGYFPFDVDADTKPEEISNFPLQADGDNPFNSRYGYDSLSAQDGCFIKINFYGRNDKYEGPRKPGPDAGPGFHGPYEGYGDDLYLILGTFPIPCQPVPR